MKPHLHLTVAATALVCTQTGVALAADCETVNISSVGWTDNEVINGFATVMLDALGYTPEISLLSMPVALESMKKGDIDTHLEFWSPGADNLTQPYLEEGSVEKVRTNLENAKYTLAVPEYTWDSGLKDFSDISEYQEELDSKIYGIEPGNDGNQNILDMIEKDAYGLGDFELVASSEQGMLSEVTRKENAEEPILFLGWSPHPMNNVHDIKYLSGGEGYFGSGSSGWTAMRAGYTEECPNIGEFLDHLVFDIEMMNTNMARVLNEDMSGEEAAREWMKNHPEQLETWLDGVETIDGTPGLEAVRTELGI